MKAGIVGMICVACLLLWGCKTTREVEREVVRDTVLIVRHDTVQQERVVVSKMETVVSDTIFIVSDTTGRVVYKEVVRNRYVNAGKADTARIYSTSKDSVYAKKNATTQRVSHPKNHRFSKTAVEAKSKSGKRLRLKDLIRGIGIIGITGIIGWALAGLYRRYKRQR